MKQLIFCVFCLMLCSITSLSITAAPKTSGMDKEGIEWIYDKKTKTLTFTGKGKTAECYNEEREVQEVTSWMAWSEKCQRVVFSDGITEIGDYYLWDFGEVKEIQLPKTLRVIQQGAFEDCRRLESIELPEKLEEIGERAFAFCKLKEINLPDSVKKIGDEAFCCNKLQEVKWFDSVSYGSRVYGWNHKVSKVTCSKGLNELPDGYMCGTHKIKKIILPNNITKISRFAFDSVKMKQVVLPDTVKRIEDRAFSGAKIDKLVLNEGLEYIGNEVFIGTEIDEIIIPDTVTYIGKGAFSGCKAKKIVLSKNTSRIQGKMFEECHKLKSIVIPKDVTEISMRAFWNCYGLENMIIESDKIEGIDATAFDGDRIEDMFGNELNYFKGITIYVPETCVSKYKGYLEQADIQRKYQILPIKKESQLVENMQSKNSSFAGKIWIVAGILVVVLVGVLVGRKICRSRT